MSDVHDVCVRVYARVRGRARKFIAGRLKTGKYRPYRPYEPVFAGHPRDGKPGNTVPSTVPTVPRHLLQYWCSDCTSPPALLWLLAAQGQWIADLYHDPDCPVLRSPSLRQAADRDLDDAVGALFALADYGDDLLIHHYALAT